MATQIEQLEQEIKEHPSNQAFTKQGYEPLFFASAQSRIAVIGQAPGRRAQESGIAWHDNSGTRLLSWLGVTEKTFRDSTIFANLPMDFYYPGKGAAGDLPPRPDFAPLWHNRLLTLLPNVSLTILVGSYAQKYYLQGSCYSTLTETVRNYQEYLPAYFPLVHPSPLNFRWLAKNPWYEKVIIPALQAQVAKTIQHE